MAAMSLGLMLAAIGFWLVQQRPHASLRYLEQLTAAEAAEVIGISLEAFMKRHLRAIGRIRRLLVHSEDESP
jgi:DNA-directed RNA polymerase specialized sigma24 family protein